MSLDEFVPCHQCGNEMFVGAFFCTRCGVRLSAAEEKSPAALEAAASPAPQITLEEVDRGFDGIEAPAAAAKSDYSREQVLQRLRMKQSLKRCGLSGLDLSGLDFEGVELTRADLDNVNLDGAKLRGALLQNASLRNASLKGADLSQANLEKADLTGAKLGSATLDGARLKRATLEGADLTGASLTGACLSSAELTAAVLSGAKLTRAQLDGAALERADLRAADLREADLANACLSHAELEGANLLSATLVDADLTRANAPHANLTRARLERAKLAEMVLREASLVDADARYADFRGADLSGALLHGIQLAHALLGEVKVSAATQVSSVDLGEQAGSGRRLEGADALAYLSGVEAAPAVGRRYFGEGDLLRDAQLAFGPGSKIRVDSRFENCVIVLGDGAELVIGESGVLRNCQIAGRGDITVHGCFIERQSPGISGPRSLVVSAKGAIAAALEQVAEPTAFAFEPGCRLRMKIIHAQHKLAAE